MASHQVVTRTALDALPDRTRAVWETVSEPLAKTYCGWPDKWFGEEHYHEISPYMVVLDELPFHYPPMSRPNYLYWTVDDGPRGPQMRLTNLEPNRHWTFFRDGLRTYLRQIADDVQAGRMDDAAKRMGIVLHFFQDTHDLHALEGPWGTDCFVLDHLMEQPAGSPYDSWLDVLVVADKKFGGCSDQQYMPRQEGVSIDEAVLRLYARYVDAAMANRRLHVPLVTAVVDGDDQTAQAKVHELYDRLVRLSMDVIYTVTALAKGWSPDAQRVAALQEVYLDELALLERPWIIPGPYRFGGMAWGHCRDMQGKRYPLAVRDGDGKVYEHERGWGGGAHRAPLPWQWELPANVYERLQGRVGLHHTLGAGGDVTVTISMGNETVIHERLNDEQPSMVVDVPVAKGGMVTMSAVATEGIMSASNNLAWVGMRVVKPGQADAGQAEV